MRAIVAVGLAVVVALVFAAVTFRVEHVSALERQFKANMERRQQLDREFDEARRQGQDTSEIRGRIDAIDAENQAIADRMN